MNKKSELKPFKKQHVASPTNCTVPSHERKFEKNVSSFFLQEFGRKRVKNSCENNTKMQSYGHD